MGTHRRPRRLTRRFGALLAAGAVIIGLAVAGLPSSPGPPARLSLEGNVAATRTFQQLTRQPVVKAPVRKVTPRPTVKPSPQRRRTTSGADVAQNGPVPSIGTTTSPAAAPAPARSMYTPPPPVATAPAVASSLGARLLAEAETQEGVPYVYGGDTPGAGFDCSGIIYWAAGQIGIAGMPRDTFEMLSTGVLTGVLVLTSDPQEGDLAFFGADHVELYVRAGETFGAQQPGTVVGFHSYGGSYVPTAYYAVR